MVQVRSGAGGILSRAGSTFVCVCVFVDPLNSALLLISLFVHGDCFASDLFFFPLDTSQRGQEAVHNRLCDWSEEPREVVSSQQRRGRAEVEAPEHRRGSHPSHQ